MIAPTENPSNILLLAGIGLVALVAVGAFVFVLGELTLRDTPWLKPYWSIASVLSGEYFLLGYRANGGNVVLERAVYITTLATTLALLAYWAAQRWGAALSLHEADGLSPAGLVAWIGAVFGVSYTSLHARFVGQWSYLATRYNQIADLSVAGESLADPVARARHAQSLATAKAAFLEDAMDLHLVFKPAYCAMVVGLIEQERVRQEFIEGTKDGEKKIRSLRVGLLKRMGRSFYKSCVRCYRDVSPSAHVQLSQLIAVLTAMPRRTAVQVAAEISVAQWVRADAIEQAIASVRQHSPRT